MRYRNAADVLPDELLKELRKYAEGESLYIPRERERRGWGEGSGARTFYRERNDAMREKYRAGVCVETLADTYGLSVETVRKIVYG